MRRSELSEIPPTNLAPVAFAFECGLAVATALVGWLLEISPYRALHSPPNRWGSLAVIGVLGAVPPSLFLLAFLRTRAAWARALRQEIERRVLPLFALSRPSELVAVSLAAGVAEEFLFRGLIQDGIHQTYPGLVGAGVSMGVAALLFGLLHWVTVAYAVMATGMGIYLGVLFWVSDSLIVPILAHGIYDVVAFFWLLRGRVPSPPSAPSDFPS